MKIKMVSEKQGECTQKKTTRQDKHSLHQLRKRATRPKS